MESNNQPNSPNKRQRQDKNKTNQLKTIFNYLQSHVATNTMVSEATGVPQKNICRFKRDLEQIGLLAEVKKDYCEITNHLAWYLTTNPKHFPQSNQLSLFDR
ncbi:MAG: hypothetical protein ACK5M1_11940 [Xanthomarina gelatinilytica]|uniref:hypothetical protein n=1 Tax=Xanthomarina gelatinilytica TaxID=1137281 RepID=UPI003A8B0562